MSQRRKRRRAKRTASRRRETALFIGVSLVMLVFILVLMVCSRRKEIALHSAILLSFVVWAVGVFAVWVCLRSRRRRHTREHAAQFSTHTDYSDLDDEESFSDHSN